MIGREIRTMESATTQRFLLALLWCSTVILGLWLTRNLLASHGWDGERADYLFKVWTIPVRAAAVVWLTRAFGALVDERLAGGHDEE